MSAELEIRARQLDSTRRSGLVYRVRCDELPTNIMIMLCDALSTLNISFARLKAYGIKIRRDKKQPTTPFGDASQEGTVDRPARDTKFRARRNVFERPF